MAALYMAAGANHFLQPAMYLRIIPPYFPHPTAISYASGIAEIILGALLLFKKTRYWAAWGITFMLVLFFAVHIYMLQQALVHKDYYISPAVAWGRLLLQPFLIAWALWHRK